MHYGIAYQLNKAIHSLGQTAYGLRILGHCTL